MIAQASPNIAILKYWGKAFENPLSDEQINIGTNPSLSLTLSRAMTHTQVTIDSIDSCEINGQIVGDSDFKKIFTHVDRVARHLNLPRRPCRIQSQNNFPAGTGLASSASAFAALTLAAAETLRAASTSRSGQQSLLSGSREIFSALARMGSGSAARSVSGPWMLWDGPYARTLPSSWMLYDTVVILSHSHKKVSSRDGHKLAKASPLFEARLKRIPERLKLFLQAIQNQSLAEMGTEIEQEAQELHAIAESSGAEYRLPETRLILKSLPLNRDYFYTLDAGPNIHFLSERPIRDELNEFLLHLNQKHSPFSYELWEDFAGTGPSIRLS